MSGNSLKKVNWLENDCSSSITLSSTLSLTDLHIFQGFYIYLTGLISYVHINGDTTNTVPWMFTYAC